MDSYEIDILCDEWSTLIDATLTLEEITKDGLQELIKDTYEVLYKYHKDTFVHKDVAKLVIRMKEFLYFSKIVEDDDETDLSFVSRVFEIIGALENGFFEGEYKYEFPKLAVSSYGFDGTETIKKEYIIDVNKDFLTR